jgi:hypothetical protein
MMRPDGEIVTVQLFGTGRAGGLGVAGEERR